jgi:hypothetical protein
MSTASKVAPPISVAERTSYRSNGIFFVPPSLRCMQNNDVQCQVRRWHMAFRGVSLPLTDVV